MEDAVHGVLLSSTAYTVVGGDLFPVVDEFWLVFSKPAGIRTEQSALLVRYEGLSEEARRAPSTRDLSS